MPPPTFEPRVVSRLLAARDSLEAGGKLTSPQRLADDIARFRAKFGPDLLQRLDDGSLLDVMHGRKERTSLMYWLEFKNDDEFCSPSFGGIAGGSALKFGVYQQTETGAWMTGSSRAVRSIPRDEAIAVARRQRVELLAAVDILTSLGPASATAATIDPDTPAYDTLDARLRAAMPTLYGLAWSHKYLSLIFPDRVDDFHSDTYQRFHQARLLCLPVDGRFAAAQVIVALARQLGESIHRTTEVLDLFHGGPYAYWRIGTVIDGKSGWADMLTSGYAAVGWASLGDLSDVASGELNPKTWEARFRAVHAHDHAATESNQRGQLLDFVRTARQRDVLVAVDGQQVLGIGELTGPYEYHPDLQPFVNTRRVQWRDVSAWKLDEGMRTTFRKLKAPANWLAIEQHLFDPIVVTRPPPGPGGSPTPGPEKTKPPLPVLDPTIARVDRILRRKGQVILYGPPGTGKTYWGERAVYELAARAWLGRALGSDATATPAELTRLGAVEKCSFHPAYGYEDFLEGFRPIVKAVGGAMAFELRDGVFKRLCDRAAKQPERPHYLLIDEINRGDIPRIFGELLSALEVDKRGTPFTLPLSAQAFMVPANVYVVGTMNTADRSIALLDAALRRRFGFVELMPSKAPLRSAVVNGLPLGPWLEQLNRRVLTYVGRDARNLQVGHAYLLERGSPIANPDRFVEVLQEDVLPLLQEYCYEDFAILEKLLGPKIVNVTERRINEELFEPARRQALFDALAGAFPDLGTTSDAVAAAEMVDDDGADDTETEDEAGA